MYKGKTAKLIQTLVIAAIYVAITFLENATVGMTKDIIQVRISEALTVLPYFTPAAIPGLFFGCLASNYIVGCHTYDIIFGSLATLIAAIGTYSIRKYKFLAPLPPIAINMIVIPLLFTYVYRYEDSFWYYVATIGIGEAIACGVLGIALMLGLEDHKEKLFPSDDGKAATVTEDKTDTSENKDKVTGEK